MLQEFTHVRARRRDRANAAAIVSADVAFAEADVAGIVLDARGVADLSQS